MKKAVLFLPLLLSAGAFAQNNTVVRWRNIVGVITAPGVDNPVGQIHSGAGPWSVRSGNAKVNLTTGEGSFDVDGLVLVGSNASGTPGGVTSVVGTLVCNPGSVAGPETAIDTPAVPLPSTGTTDLTFKISVPSSCGTPAFLIRVAGALRWIATGTEPTISSKSGY
jgi:hypothetical protein